MGRTRDGLTKSGLVLRQSLMILPAARRRWLPRALPVHTGGVHHGLLLLLLHLLLLACATFAASTRC